MHKLELVLVEEEKLATLFAILQQDFRSDVDEVANRESTVDLALVDEIDRLDFQHADLCLGKHCRHKVSLYLLVVQRFTDLIFQGLIKTYIS